MDTMAISKKMVESQEYKDSCDAMKCMLMLLKQQLELTGKMIKYNDDLRCKGYEQYRTYSHNKRHDKITTIPCNPVRSWVTGPLKEAIDKFFRWEKEHKEKTCI